MRTENKTNTRKITMIGMLCAIAYIVMAVLRIPVVMFLKYDPKDVIIAIGGFIMGPLEAFLISLIVSIIEMFTVSDTGFIGCVMNIISSCAFACTAAFVYKKVHTLAGAVSGLVLGIAATTALMLLWNYLVTPLYMGVPRETVAGMLLPVFLPFNVVKGILNMAFTLMLYKPVITTLRRTGMVERSTTTESARLNIGVYLVGALLLATGILAVLVLGGKI